MIGHQALLWRRVADQAVLGPVPGEVFADAATTPDVLIEGDVAHLYVGAVADGRERLAHLALPVDALVSGARITDLSGATVILKGGPAASCEHVFDPAALAFGDAIYLYHSAIGQVDSVGLAASADRITFARRGTVLPVGRAPEVVRSGGTVYLFYVLPSCDRGYAIHVATSADGIHFLPCGPHAVLRPGADGVWDSYEVSTPRLFQRDGMFYMMYAGGSDPARKDMPDAFGLARSRDLLHWEEYPGNPVFLRGECGRWDDGAIWFGTVFSWRETLYLVYEGGREADIRGQSPARTQVGLAAVSLDEFDAAMGSW